jgi:ABC-type sugar transport system permease subunit
MGRASAMSMVMFVSLAIFSVLQLKLFRFESS